MIYDLPLRCYLMINYDSYPGKARARYGLCSAPHPWGSWKPIWEHSFAGYYAQPTLPAKFISSDGRTLWILTSDDFTTSGQLPSKTKFCLHMIKVVLQP